MPEPFGRLNRRIEKIIPEPEPVKKTPSLVEWADRHRVYIYAAAGVAVIIAVAFSFAG